MARICTEITEWIEEKVSKPIEEWEEREERRCRRRKCKKWCLCCNKWFCWIATVLVKVIRWVVVTVVKAVTTIVCRAIAAVINIIVDLLQSIYLFVKALVLWDKCVLQEAISELGNVVGHILTSVGYILINPIVEQINRYRLRRYVEEQIDTRYGDREDYAATLKALFRVKHGAFGYRTTCTVRRMFVDSQSNRPVPRYPGVPNLFGLHNDPSTAIDLFKLAGFNTPCALSTSEGWYRPRPKTGKFPFATGGGGFGDPEPPSISKDDLTEYINSNGANGPHFRIYSMSLSDLDKKLDAASSKGRQIGLIFNLQNVDIQVFHEDFINYTVGVQERFLIDEVGRINKQVDAGGARRDLCHPVAIGVFGFTDRIQRGWATNLIGTTVCKKNNLNPDDTSGVSFVDDIPDELRKYILVHELGHYYGLCHVDGFDRIMVSGKKTQGKKLTWGAIPNTLIHGGPRFTHGEAKQVWDFILDNFPEECFVPRPVIQ